MLLIRGALALSLAPLALALSVAPPLDTVVVGAGQDDDKGANSGAAYLFSAA